MPPLIGVVTCRRALADYLESVRRAGGEPCVIDAARGDCREIVGKIDGLLLPGGGDVDPASYHETRHPSVKDVEPERDSFEFALVREALETDLPVLAICRGIQVLNVAFGGSLVQHIPSEAEGAIQHSVSEPRHAIAHEVWVAQGSRLWNVMQELLAGGESCPVNSRHHQAVKRVAAGFVTTAIAPDGIVEAIERSDARFCLGVQWHPENFWRTGEFRPVFEGFVQECGKTRR